MAIQGQSFSVIASGLIETALLISDLTFSTTYEFKIEVRTDYGYSLFSDVLSLYCGFKPEPPLVLTTENETVNVIFSWDLPVNNGAEVTEYEIYIRA